MPMIIEYFLQSKHHGCTCCGEFSNWDAFLWFEKVQNSYGKEISQIRVISTSVESEVTKISKYADVFQL